MNQNEDRVGIFQQRYTKTLLRKYGLGPCNSTQTPMSNNANLSSKTEGEKPLSFAQHRKYGTRARELLDLVVCTRSSVTFAIFALARGFHSPRERHMTIIYRVLGHLSGSKHFGLQ